MRQRLGYSILHSANGSVALNSARQCAQGVSPSCTNLLSAQKTRGVAVLNREKITTVINIAVFAMFTIAKTCIAQIEKMSVPAGGIQQKVGGGIIGINNSL